MPTFGSSNCGPSNEMQNRIHTTIGYRRCEPSTELIRLTQPLLRFQTGRFATCILTFEVYLEPSPSFDFEMGMGRCVMESRHQAPCDATCITKRTHGMNHVSQDGRTSKIIPPQKKVPMSLALPCTASHFQAPCRHAAESQISWKTLLKSVAGAIIVVVTERHSCFHVRCELG